MSKVTFVRDTGYADRFRDYHIVVDGEVVASIGAGQTIEVDVDSGLHEFWLKIDWARSNRVEADLIAGAEYVAHCESNLRGARILLTGFYAIFAKNKYLKLKIHDSTGAQVDGLCDVV